MKPLILFFLKYLLAPLSSMILIAIMSALKPVKQKLGLKKVIFFSLLSGLCLGLPSLFGLLKNEYVWGGLVLTVISYLILGTIFLKVLKMITRKAEPSPVLDILLITVSCALGMWIYYLVFDWLSDGLPYTLWAMTAVIWFIIPYTVYTTFTLFRKIQPPIYDLWKSNHSSFNRNYWDTFDSFNSKIVKVRIKRNVGDISYTTLSVRLADNISIGDWFDWMVEDQNKRFPQARIDIRMDNPESGWIFYTNKWFKFPLFIRVLNPRKTGAENKIEKNQIIYIKRVKSINHIQHEED